VAGFYAPENDGKNPPDFDWKVKRWLQSRPIKGKKLEKSFGKKIYIIITAFTNLQTKSKIDTGQKNYLRHNQFIQKYHHIGKIRLNSTSYRNLTTNYCYFALS